MDQPMTQAKFLETLKAARSEWEALLARVPKDRMSEPGADGWSVKDILAHVAWYEREMLAVARARALAGSDLWNKSLEERNAAIYEENRHRPLAEVLAEAEAMYRQLAPELEALTDEDLMDARRFREMPAEWLPWQVLASNTYEHYQEHIPQIQAWLEERAASR
jgi:uncharacterized protein (TIGR03083 family)